jgi:ABC transporter with metal-binding/Fe-S-binding domain ATP-binding protein
MKLGVLFSGGKDSCFALWKASKEHDISCLITLESANSESYMFHTPNIKLTRLQAEAMGLPIVSVATAGEKEAELADLRAAIARAVKEFGIEGIVTGAIDSVYQSTRIQQICNQLGLWCFNPLWQRQQPGLLEELVASRFLAIITGVFAYPLGSDMLGRDINRSMIAELSRLQEKHGISPSGEGGEIETFVLDGPIFKKRILLMKKRKAFSRDSGTLVIEEAGLVPK